MKNEKINAEILVAFKKALLDPEKIKADISRITDRILKDDDKYLHFALLSIMATFQKTLDQKEAIINLRRNTQEPTLGG